MEKLPASTLDKDGYPTDKFLNWIESFNPTEMKWIDFIEILADAWWMADWGFKLKRKRNGKRTLELHTGGWSGNEEIIAALRQNIFFFPMTWEKTYAGGHYYFRIPVD